MRTVHKIALARLGYKAIHLLRRNSDRIMIRRHGVQWDLDISEVIEFCVFLFGSFEAKTIALYKRLVKPGDTVIDVGANIGSHSLPLAQMVGPRGRVVSLEPAQVTFGKLRRNIELNPDLAKRISALQRLVVAPGTQKVDAEVYASWPFESTAQLHEKHRGQLISTQGASAATLDEIVASQGLTKVNLIKIDVEGHEHRVLRGGLETIRKYKPRIVIELAPYSYQDPKEFDGIFEVLREFKPVMTDVNTGAPLAFDPASMRALIPDGSSRNALIEFKV